MSESESFFTSIKKWFSVEASEAAQVKRDVSRRLDEDLTRREAELEATPSERLDNIQHEIDSSNSFDEIQAKIDASTTGAELDGNELDSRKATESAGELEADSAPKP